MARLALVVMAVVVAVVAGCGSGADRVDRSGGIDAETVRFRWGQRTFTAPVTECGRDGDVVILASGSRPR